MPSFLEHVENALGRAFASIRGHDEKLFTKTQGFDNHPKPTITVSSPECGDSTSRLQIQHTPLGENRFPELSWEPSTPAEGETLQPEIAQYLVIVEDPDAPLPSPIVHGIYYGISPNKTQLTPKDFTAAPEFDNALHGGFRYGLNRMKSVWGGPKPVLGHGPHRYMFQVVRLSSGVEGGKLSKIATRAELERAVDGKVVAWGTWIGTYERKVV